MQDKKLINLGGAVSGKNGVYSWEFHEDDGYSHIKRANPDGTATYFRVAGEKDASPSTFRWVSEASDFGVPVDGVYTLSNNTTYYITTTVDLSGGRLVAGSNTVITGASSEVSRLTSTGLGVGVPLLTATDVSLPMQNVSLQDVDTAVAINASGKSDAAYDWYGVNFLNVPNIGTIANGNNFVYINGAFLNSKGMVFDGTFNTIAFDTAFFQGDGLAGSLLSLPASAVIQRRFRIIYSSFVAFGSTTALDVSTSATVPNEGYILDTCNFSGGSTYVSGVQHTDNKARWDDNRGIDNSAVLAGYYVNGNATATTIATIATPVKAAGTTTVNPLSQKFTHASNRATYTGSLNRIFKFQATISLSSGNNNQVGVYIAKNGSILPESETYTTTGSGGRSEGVAVQAVVELDTNDYIEVWVENNTSTTAITLTDINLLGIPL